MALVGDQHNADHAPKSRVDDYASAILGKQEYILNWCRDNDVPTVVLLGDLFDKKQAHHNSHWLVQSIVKLYRSAQPDVTTYSLVGNHDYTTDISTVVRQPIQTVFESQAIRPLGLSNDSVLFHFDDFDVELHGKEYSNREDGTECSPEAFRLTYQSETSFKIACYHATLLPDGKSFFYHFTNFGDVAPFIDADFIACGHYHPGYEPPVQQAYGKTWTNPGSISRGTTDEHNLTRELKFAVLTYDGENPTTEMIPIPHAPASEVFKAKVSVEETVSMPKADQFINDLNARLNATEVVSAMTFKKMARDATKNEAVYQMVAGLIDEAEHEG